MHVTNHWTYWILNTEYKICEEHLDEPASFRLVNQQLHLQFYWADYSLINRCGFLIIQCSFLNSAKYRLTNTWFCKGCVFLVCTHKCMCPKWREWKGAQRRGKWWRWGYWVLWCHGGFPCIYHSDCHWEHTAQVSPTQGSMWFMLFCIFLCIYR